MTPTRAQLEAVAKEMADVVYYLSRKSLPSEDERQAMRRLSDWATRLRAALAPAPEPAPMPALEVGDWVLAMDGEAAAVDAICQDGTLRCDACIPQYLPVSEVTEIRGTRDGVPFVWQRQTGEPT